MDRNIAEQSTPICIITDRILKSEIIHTDTERTYTQGLIWSKAQDSYWLQWALDQTQNEYLRITGFCSITLIFHRLLLLYCVYHAKQLRTNKIRMFCFQTRTISNTIVHNHRFLWNRECVEQKNFTDWYLPVSPSSGWHVYSQAVSTSNQHVPANVTLAASLGKAVVLWNNIQIQWSPSFFTEIKLNC